MRRRVPRLLVLKRLVERTGKGGVSGKEKPTDENKEVVKKCVEDPAAVKCSIPGELSACLQVSQNASTGSFVVVQNTGQNTITVSVKATSDISIEQQLPPLNLTKGDFKTNGLSLRSQTNNKDGWDVDWDD